MSEKNYSVGKIYSLGINTPQPLNITFTDGSQLIFPVSGKASFTGDVEESARVFFDAVIRHRDSQLEAERRRADDAHKYGSERDAENESLMLTVGRLRLENEALRGNHEK